ncbi:MAG: ABC transporter ATP-binding protein/permease [Rhizobiales bacterium]|nr:ABC transporter ATP-binding protein/permease [Hyphomicrobiales bacterium]
MQNLGKTLAIVWRLAAPYFRSDDKWPGRILLASVIAIELALVGLDVLFNQWYARFYNALQERNWDTFVSELTYFAVIAAIFIVLAVYQLYLNQWLQIRWRAWMTRHYLGEWLHDANHYRMQLLGDAADNPDQRLTDDIKMFVEQTLNISIGLLSSVVTLFSFFIILWGLSAAAPLHVFGQAYNIPGYLVWGALVYAVIGTALTHLVGRPLIRLDFMQQRYEADFRFNLVRARENAEQIALLHGEAAERNQLLKRFQLVIDNWIAIMIRTKKVTALTASYSQAAKVFPFILVAPAYFAGKIQLGGMMQTASAFGSVQGALSFFVTAYRSLAEWRAVVSRLDGFEASIAHATTLPSEPDRIVRATTNDATVALDDLLLQLPNGKPMVTAKALRLRPGETTLIKGPSGSGKSTLFRAIGGIWPFGTGTIRIPTAAKLMFLPQRSYFPVGTLKAAIAYPAEPDTFDDNAVRAAIQTVGLPALADHLDEEAHWNARLSLGEQQRLGLARALLAKPDYLFLDEATASLDETAEAKLYDLLATALPSTTIVSIGHRGTLDTLHAREIALTPSGTAAVAYAIKDDGMSG